jgi:diguanylate cyclase (GGDEF)-like protein/PAS domain S-box-containing protein
MDSSKLQTQQGQVFRFDQGGALLRKVMENAAVGMALVGVDQRLLYANTAFAEMLGYTIESALGLPVGELIHPDSGAFLVYLNRLIAGEVDEYRGEGQLRGREGHPIWVLASASVLRSDKSGRPVYLILQTTNVDRQKKAEAALAYTESRWNSALEAAKQGVWEHDSRRPDDMYYSPMWRKMRGFSPYEYVDPAQGAWIERLHPDDRERIRATVGKQERGDDGFDTLEYRERHKDGHYLWILSRGRPVEWDAAGNVVRTIGTDTDITRLKDVERALAVEKERLRVTLESIGDGVISTDSQSRISFMNPIAEEMTGWTEQSAVGRPLAEVFHAIDHTSGLPSADPVARSLESGRLTHADEEVVLVGREGNRRDIRASASPVRTPGGKIIGAVLVFQDVTQSRALQKELAHSASHDGLTGLPNRAAFDRALAAAVISAHEGERTHALCYIDLDRFKPVNDTAGHAAGDALLRVVADTIRRCFRAADFAARVGGDEFALLLMDCPIREAAAVATTIVKSVAAIEFVWNGTTYRIGASVGITPVTKDAESALAVTGEADAACYAAKRAGRGRAVVYSSALGAEKQAVTAA